MNVNPADFAGHSGLPAGERPALSHGMGAIAVILSLIGFVWLLNAKDVLSDAARRASPAAALCVRHRAFTIDAPPSRGDDEITSLRRRIQWPASTR